MPKNDKQEHLDPIQKKKLERQKAIRKLKILVVLGVLLLVLLFVIIFASLRQGGISNLFQGDSDVVTNTIKNIGTSFTGTEPTAQPTPTIEPPKVSDNKTDITKSQQQNFIVFTTISTPYKITIKKNTFVSFRNTSGADVALKFSNERSIRLNQGAEKNMLFPTVGTVTFEDQLDTTPNKIRGEIIIVN